MEFNLWTSGSAGNPKNCLYPNRITVRSLEDFRRAGAFDHVCAQYKRDYRSKENFIRADCIVMDCDNDQSDDPSQWVTEDVIRSSFQGVSMVIAPSRNSGKVKGGKGARPRFHVYFPIEPVEDAEDYAEIKQKVLQVFPRFDGNAVDAARFIFGCDVSGAVWVEGDMSLEGFIGFDFLGVNEGIPEGQRNTTLSRFAGKVLKRYGDVPLARKLFYEKAALCNPPLESGELDTIWGSARKFAARVAKQPGYVPPEEYGKAEDSFKPGDYSDVGQAEVLAREYRDRLVYTPATGYLKYDGKFWEESEERSVGTVQELTRHQLAEAYEDEGGAKDLMKSTGAAALIAKEGLTKAKKEFKPQQLKAYEALCAAREYVKFAIQRRDIRYINSCLAAARPMLDIPVDDLDSDGMLLNTPAGIYDLTHGLKGLMPHDPKKYLTKITAVSPSMDGCAIWRKALQTFFCGDEELIEYVQQVVGLCAIGRVYVEALVIAYGDGRNGKSTFWNTISRVMGSYKGDLSADTLTTGCSRNVKPEVAETKGRRLVIASELNEGMRLNTSLVKQLCSTDKIFAEKKYHAPFSFTPSHTLVLFTNHLPAVSSNDAGTWRRLLLIPFKAVIEGKADIKNYAEYLYNHCAGAIMTWIIEGAKKVYDSGFHLDTPACVQEAVNSYKDDNDWLGRFINACCEVDPNFYEKSGDLYSHYHAYAKASGEWPKGTNAFYAALDNKGFKRHKTRSVRYVSGLRLKCEDFTAR